MYSNDLLIAQSSNNYLNDLTSTFGQEICRMLPEGVTAVDSKAAPLQ
jgi:hypothetical protein